ncbi:hypothetical protein C8F01DRAFT_1258546 [Mycena amicta]|nr:hypothetical protein C8F01DRAFT_1258546 [Mycena amicta]
MDPDAGQKDQMAKVRMEGRRMMVFAEVVWVALVVGVLEVFVALVVVALVASVEVALVALVVVEVDGVIPGPFVAVLCVLVVVEVVRPVELVEPAADQVVAIHLIDWAKEMLA